MIGSDAERLELAAAELRRAADELDGHSSSLQKTLSSLSWIGQVAVNFISMWNGGHRVQLASTAAFFREAATKLDVNARQQRDASAASGGAAGGSGVGANWPSGAAGIAPGWSVPWGQIDEAWGNLSLAGGVIAELGDLTGLDRVLSVAGAGVDGFKLGAAIGEGDTDGAIRAGIDVVWDVASLHPVIGVSKLTWDVSYSATKHLYEWADNSWDLSGAWMDSTLIHRYGTTDLTAAQAKEMSTRYDGWSGFGNWASDSVGNLKFW